MRGAPVTAVETVEGGEPAVEAPRRRPVWRRVAGWLPETWRAIDTERGPAQPFGSYEAGLLIVVAVSLAVIRFFSRGGEIARWVGPSQFSELLWHLQWVLVTVVGYVALPVAYLKLRGRRIRDHNVGWGSAHRHAAIYVGLFVVMIPIVVLISGTRAYQAIYPFYDGSFRSWFDLITWEVAYGLQFAALEFFFRGFMLEGLRRTMGHAAIFVMVVPYCMIHFGKTFSESMAAIVAGVVLGTMAMRWRTIWGGVAVHWLVAISMDVAALIAEGDWPPPRLLP